MTVVKKTVFGIGIAVLVIFAIIGIIGAIALVLFFTGATGIAPHAAQSAPKLVPVWVTAYDGGVQVRAGETWYLSNLDGKYQFQVTASDAVQIYTFPTDKDYKLWNANAEFEYIGSCSARNSIRFNQECNLGKGAMFVVHNGNLLSPTNVLVKITKLTYQEA